MAKKKAPLQRQTAVASLPEPPKKKAEDYLKAYKSWAYASIGAIAQEIASTPFKLYKKKLEGGKVKTEEVVEHESLSLLHYVNDFTTLYDLIEATQVYLELVGEAYWGYIKDGNGKVQEIWPLRPDWIKVVPSKTDFIKGYQYHPGGSYDKIFFEKDQVTQFKYFSPTNPYRGHGTVQAAAMELDTDDFSAAWNRNFFFNNAMPNFILTTEAKMDEQEIKRFVEQWQAKFGGKQNAHKFGFLSGGKWDVKEIGDKMKDMHFTEQRELMRDSIMAIFKVPKTILGITTDVNRANAREGIRSFMERTITPKVRKFVAHLNEFYLPQFDNTEEMFFDFEDPAPEDVELNMKIYESGLNYGWLTTNEVRERENLPPVTNGDVIYRPVNMVPIGEDGKEIEEAADKGIIKHRVRRGYDKREGNQHMMPLPPKRLREIRAKKEAEGISADLVKLVSELMTNKDMKAPNKLKGMSEEVKANLWHGLIDETDVQERAMLDIVREQLGRQHDKVLENLDSIKYYAYARRKGKETSMLFNLAKENAEWLTSMLPFLKNVLEQRGNKTLRRLGLDQGINSATDIAKAFLETQAGEMIKGINETTREKLKKTLAEGFDQQESIQSLRIRVSKVFQEAAGSRATMIARTEVLRASNFGAQLAYEQSGVVERKEWLTALDDRTCPICQPLNGKIIDLKGNFKADGISVDQPPIHPRCRCTTVPVLESSEKSQDWVEMEVKNEEAEKELKEKKEQLKKIDEKAEKKKRVTKKLVEKELEKLEKHKESLIKQAKDEATREGKKQKKKLIKQAETERENILEDLQKLKMELEDER